MDINVLERILADLSSRHSHLCPRQVLGARIGMAGGAALGFELPRTDKKLLVILETDGCFVDGIRSATGLDSGRRTMRIEDYGKVAATFVDTKNGQAVRIAPRLDVRQRALDYAPEEVRHYFAQLKGYQVMPDEELFTIQAVTLSPTIEEILSRPGVRLNCSVCGEEIINQREIYFQGEWVCRSCSGEVLLPHPSILKSITSHLPGKELK